MNEEAIRERLESHSEPEPNTGCVLWLGARSTNRCGRHYGTVTTTNKTMRAHRVAWSLENGPIPHGLTIDHLCRNTLCVNPRHLEAVTMRDNILRGTGATAENKRKVMCRNGHSLSGGNLMIRSDGRECRTCHYKNSASYRKRRRLKAILGGRP